MKEVIFSFLLPLFVLLFSIFARSTSTSRLFHSEYGGNQAARWFRLIPIINCQYAPRYERWRLAFLPSRPSLLGSHFPPAHASLERSSLSTTASGISLGIFVDIRCWKCLYCSSQLSLSCGCLRFNFI